MQRLECLQPTERIKPDGSFGLVFVFYADICLPIAAIVRAMAGKGKKGNERMTKRIDALLTTFQRAWFKIWTRDDVARITGLDDLPFSMADALVVRARELRAIERQLMTEPDKAKRDELKALFLALS